MQRACRSMSQTLDRRLTTPSGRAHSLRGANRPGPCGVPASIRQICSRSRCASMPRQSDRAATARCELRFRMLSSNRTTPQVDQATHTEAFADFAQLLATGREGTAQQPVPAMETPPKSPTPVDARRQPANTALLNSLWGRGKIKFGPLRETKDLAAISRETRTGRSPS